MTCLPGCFVCFLAPPVLLLDHSCLGMLLVLASHALELTLNQCSSLDYYYYYYVSLSDTVLNQLHKCLLQRIEVVDASNLCTPSPTGLALLRRRACC